MSQSNTENYEFKAEINELMNIIVNSLYQKPEVAIRELISNSCDASSKRRYECLTKGKLLTESDLKIQIVADKTNNTLTISDNGIGMTKNDLIDKLSTIAVSGTREFIKKLSDNKETSANTSDYIGSFGVGFLSSLLLADHVEVVTKNESDQQYRWECKQRGSYTITPTGNTTVDPGTSVILHLKPDQTKYLEENEIKEIVKKHSQFINYPIELLVEKEREVDDETPSEENKEEDKKDECCDHDHDHDKEHHEHDKESNEDEVKVEDELPELEDQEEEGEEGKKKDTKPKKKVRFSEFEQLNTQKPIWTRDPKEVTKEEYHSFYKNFTSDWEEPLAYKHFKLDGQVQMKGILYVPKKAPFDLFEKKKNKDNVKLYVKRVLITENCDDFMPEYLSFVKGVVDCDDLPLNVSREFIQNSSMFKTIKNSLVKKCLELFSEILDNQENYKLFYESYQKNIKLGIHDDTKNKSKLVDLLRFFSMKNPDNLISLDDYVKGMKENQKSVYFLSGENKEMVSSSPFLEECRKRDFDVLFMVDAIDEYIMQQLSEYKEKKLVNISKEGNLFDETDEEKKQREELDKSYADLCKFLKEHLKDRVEKVVLSSKLVDSPAIVSSGGMGWTANMERIMKAQALGNNQMHAFMMSRKTLELNPNHELVKQLNNKLANKEEQVVRDTASLLFETCLLNSGYSLDNVTSFTNRIYGSMLGNLASSQ